MALTPKLKATQSQKLTMTPQMRQAIRLLQMSNLELSDFLQEAAEQNPLLAVELPEAQTAIGANEMEDASRPTAVDTVTASNSGTARNTWATKVFELGPGQSL